MLFYIYVFKLSEKYQIGRRSLKCDYIRNSPSKINTINKPNSQNFFNIPRRDFVNSLKGSILILNFDVLHAATNNRYVNDNVERLVNLGPLFKIYKLATSSGKHIEEISHAHIVCLLYKLISSATNTEELSFGFDRDRGRRQRDSTNNKK